MNSQVKQDATLEDQLITYAVDRPNGFTVGEFISDTETEEDTGKIFSNLMGLCRYKLIRQERKADTILFYAAEGSDPVESHNTSDNPKESTMEVTTEVTTEVEKKMKTTEDTNVGKHNGNMKRIYDFIESQDAPVSTRSIAEALPDIQKNSMASLLFQMMSSPNYKVDRAKIQAEEGDMKLYHYWVSGRFNKTQQKAVDLERAKSSDKSEEKKSTRNQTEDHRILAKIIHEASGGLSAKEIKKKAVKQGIRASSVSPLLSHIATEEGFENLEVTRKKLRFKHGRACWVYFGKNATTEDYKEHEEVETTESPVEEVVEETPTEVVAAEGGEDIQDLLKEVIELRLQLKNEMKAKAEKLYKERAQLKQQLDELKGF